MVLKKLQSKPYKEEIKLKNSLVWVLIKNISPILKLLNIDHDDLLYIFTFLPSKIINTIQFYQHFDTKARNQNLETPNYLIFFEFLLILSNEMSI